MAAGENGATMKGKNGMEEERIRELEKFEGGFMSKIVMASFAFLFTVLSVTQLAAVDKKQYVSEPEAIFCIDLQAINNLKTFMAQKDKNATAKLFDKGDCLIVKPSLNVFIVQEKGDLVRVRREGMTDFLWTFRGALR
jgi:hypothetical protein